MIQQIKFTKEQAREDIVFLSDLHLNQNAQWLVDSRKTLHSDLNVFSTPEEHDEWILSEWEKNLSDKIVFDLGDQTFKDPKGEMFTRLSNLPCKEHYVVAGNHRSGFKQCYQEALGEWCVDNGLDYRKPSFEVYPLPFNNLTFCGLDITLKVGKQEIHLSHFAKRLFDNLGHGSIHLSGHSHSSDSDRNVSNKNGKTLDVGVENAISYDDKFWFTYEDIENIMSQKEIQILDHHNQNTNPS